MSRIVFVHGSVGNGDSAWAEQRPLADDFELVVLNRPGFPPGPLVDRVDFEEHAVWVAERLQPGDNLCGHSYGAVVSLYAAAEAELASLTVVEPPAFGIAAGRPGVDEFAERLRRLWADGPDEPRAFLVDFYAAVAGRPIELPDPLPDGQYQGAQILMRERGPWEARPPLDALRAAPFPKLVVSGGWSPAFDAVCDVLEERLAAARVVLPGSGHNPQLLGRPFNDALRSFVESAR